MYRNFHLAVNGLIVKGDKVLLHHRTDGDWWDLPGGGIKKSETIFQTLKREVKEETGLIVKPIKLVGIYQNYYREVIVFNFLVKVLSGKLTLNIEADDFKYFNYKQLPKNTIAKQKQRILDYFNKKSLVKVRIQKSLPTKK